MSDEKENVESLTLRLLREMREENAQFRNEMNDFRRSAIARLESVERSNQVIGDTVIATSKSVERLAGVVEKIATAVGSLQSGQKIVEQEIRALRGRVERIEDNLGFAKI